MGKTSRFFKSFFAFFKPKPHQHLSDPSLTRPRHTPRHHPSSDQTQSPTHHAIAAASAAVAAAHAAAEMVRMTARTTVAGSSDYGLSGELAAVKIQSYYRGYLARKALRALKSLVKLQALVRGHLQRKQDADDLRRYQALVRVQDRAHRACWAQSTDSSQSTTKGPPTPEKFEHVRRSRIMKHNQPSMLKINSSKLYDDRSEKILEIDATKSHMRRRNIFQPDHISYSQSQSLTTSRGSMINTMGPSPSGSCEVSSLTGPQKWFPHDFEEQVSLCAAQNSPPVSSKNVSVRVSPFTPAKSDSSRSCLSGYSDHPNYMAYTESSRAKVRSLSAPRQRPNLEFPSTTKRYSVYGYGSGAPRGSNLRDSFVSKAYPGSGRLDRLGMPIAGIGFRESEFSGGYWN